METMTPAPLTDAQKMAFDLRTLRLHGVTDKHAHRIAERNAARRAMNAALRELCGTSARAAREDMGI